MMRDIWHRFVTRLSWQFTALSITAVLGDLWTYFGWHPQIDWLGLIAIEIAVLTVYLDFKLHRRAEQLYEATAKIASRAEELHHTTADIASRAEQLYQTTDRTASRAEELHHTTAQIASRAEQLNQITEQIALAATTRYLGQAPWHLQYLADLMSNAHSGDEVLVLLDFFGHGHYSNPEGYEAYFKAFKLALERQVKVRILLCDEEDVRTCTKAQFDTVDKESPEYKTWIAYYKSILKGYRPESLDDFIEALIYINDDFCNQLLTMHPRGGSIGIRRMPARNEKETTSWMKEVIYIWMVRDSEMIFSFPRFYGAKSGHTFRTREARLIENFQRRFEAKWNDRATPIVEPMHIYEKCFKAVSAKIQGPEKSFDAGA